MTLEELNRYGHIFATKPQGIIDLMFKKRARENSRDSDQQLEDISYLVNFYSKADKLTQEQKTVLDSLRKKMENMQQKPSEQDKYLIQALQERGFSDDEIIGEKRSTLKEYLDNELLFEKLKAKKND